ncbi:MAG: hypothetical protein H6Q30_1278 [Bacteroidetes bacterium]|nr:hypothetical protein [Bacteroidota bacterium]
MRTVWSGKVTKERGDFAPGRTRFHISVEIRNSTRPYIQNLQSKVNKLPEQDESPWKYHNSEIRHKSRQEAYTTLPTCPGNVWLGSLMVRSR